LPFFQTQLSNPTQVLENKIKPAFIGGLVYLGRGARAKREFILV